MSEQQKDVFIYERVVNTGKYTSRRIGLHKVNDTGLPIEEFAKRTISFIDAIADKYEEQVNISEPLGSGNATPKQGPATAMAPTSRKKFDYKGKA